MKPNSKEKLKLHAMKEFGLRRLNKKSYVKLFVFMLCRWSSNKRRSGRSGVGKNRRKRKNGKPFESKKRS